MIRDAKQDGQKILDDFCARKGWFSPADLVCAMIEVFDHFARNNLDPGSELAHFWPGKRRRLLDAVKARCAQTIPNCLPDEFPYADEQILKVWHQIRKLDEKSKGPLWAYLGLQAPVLRQTRKRIEAAAGEHIDPELAACCRD
ncbi:MAG: hypothetical protein U0836_17900 [Pirellulales bacterium]